MSDLLLERTLPGEVRFGRRYRVDEESGCWMWTGGKDTGGYGTIKVDGVRWRASRYSWFLHRGEIPAGMCVMHSCDRPACVNPEHLSLGTPLDNAEDRERKGRGNQPKGARNSRSILVESQVREIRVVHAGGVSIASLSRLLAISEEHIRSIVKGRTWR